MVAKAYSSNVVLPSDPDVKVPAGVKAAAAKADAAFKAAYPDQVTSNTTSAEADPPQTSAGEPAGAASSGQSSPAQVQEQVAPAPSEVSQQQDINWEHRFNSMRGRHDKAQDSIKQMAEQISNLQNVLATVQSGPAPVISSELQFNNLLSPEEVSEYGEEFLGVVGKKAQEATTPLVQELRQEIDALKQQVGRVGGSIAQNARENMFGQLDGTGMPWREINKDPRFLQWLALPDTYSGVIRHNLLKAAWERNDTPRAAAFFQGFLAEEAAIDPARGGFPQGSLPNEYQASFTPEGNTFQGNGRTNGKVPLESFAAPGRAKSAAGSIPAEKPQISRSQISSFYAQCAAGKYRGNEQERNRLERMIFEAQSEGRITG
jgi:hypothetical protein